MYILSGAFKFFRMDARAFRIVKERLRLEVAGILSESMDWGARRVLTCPSNRLVALPRHRNIGSGRDHARHVSLSLVGKQIVCSRSIASFFKCL